jgi:hypothetical protein
MSHEWLATSDKWGILPILSTYPSFNNIPDRKVETHIEQFSQNYRKFFETVGLKYFHHSFESYKTRGKDQFPIGCENEPKEWGFFFN